MKKALSIVHPEIQASVLTILALGVIVIIALGFEVANGGNWYTLINI